MCVCVCMWRGEPVGVKGLSAEQILHTIEGECKYRRAWQFSLYKEREGCPASLN